MSRVASPILNVIKIIVLLFGLGVFCYLLRAPILKMFYANIYINSIIVLLGLLGLLLCIIRLFRLFNYSEWINSAMAGVPSKVPPGSSIRPVGNLLKRLEERQSLSANLLTMAIDSLSARLEGETRLLSYLSGVLVFFGLLGTFWGLMITIESVRDTISALSIDVSGSSALFDSLKDGLKRPLGGMAIAFSSSLFGLACSLIVGFAGLQVSLAHALFIDDIEDIFRPLVAANINDGRATSVNYSDSSKLLDASLNKFQRTLDESANQTHSSVSAMANLAEGVHMVVSQLKIENNKLDECLTNQSLIDSKLEKLSNISENTEIDNNIDNNIVT